MKHLMTNQKIDELQTVLADYDLFIDKFSAGIGKTTFNLHQRIVSDLLVRVKINVHSIAALLASLKIYSPTFLSIGLLNRTIIADFITYCYMTSILKAGRKHELEEEEINTILQNEVHILDLAYVKAMVASVKLEGKLPEYNPQFAKVFENKEHDAALKRLKTTYAKFFKSDNPDNEYKSVAEFRSASTSKLFDKEKIKLSPTESFMHTFATENGFAKHTHSYLLFRFYSQFQHYSSHSIQLIKPAVNDYNFFYLVFTLNYAFILTDMILQNLQADHPTLLRLREITESLGTTLK